MAELNGQLDKTANEKQAQLNQTDALIQRMQSEAEQCIVKIKQKRDVKESKMKQ